ncbi:hypothetical protein KW791_02425, partial [Candidatus Parcubacteria bacterium]|nr:hypothetical protein [Candidatus Parcubacteria bacterium]
MFKNRIVATLAIAVMFSSLVSVISVRAEEEATSSDVVVSEPVSSPAIDRVVEPVVQDTEEPTPVVEPVSEFSSETVSETTSVSSPLLTTDKDDYYPEENVSLFGSLFESLKTYSVRIFGNSYGDEIAHESEAQVTTDSNGSFIYNFVLENVFVPLYNVVVNTLDGEEVAMTTFKDASGASIDMYTQCSNDDGDGYTGADIGCHWTSGNLNSSNSTYHEDDSSVQRLAIDNLTPGIHTVIVKYSTTKGGKHSYDFMTDDNFSELAPNALTSADLCDPAITNLASCASLTPVLSGLIPTDPNAAGHDVARANRHFKIRNGTWVGSGISSGPTLVSGTYAGDSDTALTLQFNVPNLCADKHSGKCEVLITWGAHVSTQADWGAGNSAVNISGSPYHVQIADVDGDAVTGGGRDNQMAASAIIQTGTIVIHKNTVPDAAQDFGFTTTGLTPTTFNLDDDADPTLSNTQTFTGVNAGTYSVTENANAAYAVTISCTDPSGGTSTNNASRVANINLAAGETVDCTYTNTLQQGHLTLVKTVTNDNGGAAFPLDWTLSATGPTPISGVTGNAAITNAAVNAGTYTLAESTGPTGYTAGSWSCDAGTLTVNSLVLAAGQNATCTINNDDNAPHLTLVKQVVGAALPSSWTLSATGPISISGATSSSAVTNAGVNVGTYALSETGPSGYTASAWSCVGGTQNSSNITLGLGQSATCTITNTELGHIVIVKDAQNNDAQDFTFHNNFGNSNPATFLLDDDGVSGSATPNTMSFNVVPGAYLVSEDAVAGWQQESATCDQGETVGSIDVAAGETVTCTFVNEKYAR